MRNHAGRILFQDVHHCPLNSSPLLFMPLLLRELHGTTVDVPVMGARPPCPRKCSDRDRPLLPSQI